MKKIFAITFICSILSISTVFAKNITVLLNNTAIAYTQQPMLKNNTTCVPMKQTAEALGATVSWNVPTKTAIARKENIIVSACENSKTLIITKGETTNRITMPTPAYIENGTMFVPLRPLLNAFEINMTWDSSTNTAKIENTNSFFTEKIEQKTLKNKDGIIVWEAKLYYPELKGESEAISKINQVILNDIQSSLSAMGNEIAPDDINTDLYNMLPYTLDCTYNITYLDENTISLLLDYYEFTGGAHGMPYRQAYTFDLKTGNQLQLSDIVHVENADEFAKNAFKNNIAQNPESYFNGATETVDSEYFEYDFYIQPNEIILFTQAYLLEPYANHFQPTIISKSEIQNILNINI